MNRLLKVLPAFAIGFAVAACEDTLVVDNVVNPDIERVFATPAAIERVVASGYQACHNAHVVNADLNAQLLVLGLESYSQLNNFFMGPRGGIPRTPVVNQTGTDGNHFGVFSRLNRAGRLQVNAIRALDSLVDAGGSLGSTGQNNRARAFTFFSIACNQGWLAMVYDSAAIMSAGLDASGNPNPAFHFDSVPPLAGYAAVMANAIAMLDSAEAAALLVPATGTGNFPLPSTWLSGTAHASRDGFIRLIRSYRARFRAGVVRTPLGRRDSVNWNAVLTDLTTGLGGIQSHFTVTVGGSTGWNGGFVSSQMHVEGAWSQMSLMYFGMADQAGGCYDAQIAAARNDRNPDCLIITPDNRWPAGATRAAQRTASPTPSIPASPAGLTYLDHRPYLRNNPGQDTPGDGWGWSQYLFYRMRYIRDNNGNGEFPDMVKPEVDLLAAEAYLRRTNGDPNGATVGDIQLAAALIDRSRVNTRPVGQAPNGAGLPALTGVVLTMAQPVPGGTSCVPRVPQPPNFNTTACGTLFEALKYEKRMETAYTGFGQWYFDGRGWNDLVENTPVQYPVPFAELNALSKPNYALGGGGLSSAARGTYGF